MTPFSKNHPDITYESAPPKRPNRGLKSVLPGAKPMSAIERKIRQMKKDKDLSFINAVAAEHSNLQTYIAAANDTITDVNKLFANVFSLTQNQGVMSAIDQLDGMVSVNHDGAIEIKQNIALAIQGYKNDQNAASELLKDIQTQQRILESLMSDSDPNKEAEKLRVASNLDALTISARWLVNTQLGLTAANLMTTMQDMLNYVEKNKVHQTSIPGAVNE